jgi:hypothetical protein
MVVAIASMVVAVVALTLALGGFATAGPKPEKGDVEILTTAGRTLDFGWTPGHGEGGEIDLTGGPLREFVQEAGTTVLMIADATSSDLPAGCWMDFWFSFDLDGDAIPDQGPEDPAFRISAEMFEGQYHVGKVGTSVNTLSPPAADRTVRIQAFHGQGCDWEYEGDDVLPTVTFTLTVLGLR